MKRAAALVACAGIAVASARPAAADALADAEGEEAVRSTPEEAQENLAVVTLGGGPLIMDGTSLTAPAWNLELAGKGASWPLLLGFSGGAGFFDVERPGDPYTTVAFRRFEAVVRYQPFWGVVRPYAQASLGIGWMTYTKGAVLVTSEEEKYASTSAVAGLGLGIDWRLFSFAPRPSGTQSVVLSTGVKRLFTTSALNPATHDHEALAMWMPFVAIGIAFDGRAEKREKPEAPPQEPDAVTIDVKGVKESQPGPHYR